MGDAIKTREDQVFLRRSRYEWMNVIVSLGSGGIKSTSLCGCHSLIPSIVEFILLLGSKKGMRLGDEIAKTTVIETL